MPKLRGRRKGCSDNAFRRRNDVDAARKRAARDSQASITTADAADNATSGDVVGGGDNGAVGDVAMATPREHAHDSRRRMRNAWRIASGLARMGQQQTKTATTRRAL